MVSRGIFWPAITIVILLWFVLPREANSASRALVIGVSDYNNLPSLKNPSTDANHFASKLKSAGYNVTLVLSPATTRNGIIQAFDKFSKSINEGDDVVVFYSGHGIDVRGQNMFVPSDSPGPNDVLTESGLADVLIPMRDKMMLLADSDPHMQVWIIDACRDDPYAAAGQKPFLTPGGLGNFGSSRNTFIFFAADYARTARDTLPNDPPTPPIGSPFSRTLIGLFDSWKDKDIGTYAQQVRLGVLKLMQPYNYDQFPIFENGVIDNWCFVRCSLGIQKIAVSESASASQGSVEDVRKPENGTAADAKAVVTRKTKAGLLTETIIPASGSSATAVSSIIEKSLNRNVVFLGKETSTGCAKASVSDLYPFGCEVLRKISAHFRSGNSDPSDGLVGQQLVAQTEVNLRKGLPHTGKSGTAYGCKVKELAKGASISPESTVALTYAGDTFYWAILSGPPDPCVR